MDEDQIDAPIAEDKVRLSLPADNRCNQVLAADENIFGRDHRLTEIFNSVKVIEMALNTEIVEEDMPHPNGNQMSQSSSEDASGVAVPQY